MRVDAVQSEDQAYIRSVAEVVCSAYDGQVYHWRLADSGSLWKIHFGVSAGVVGVAIDGRRACVKLFYDRRLKARFRNALRMSKAGLAYRKGQALIDQGIACPAILGYAENNRGMGLVVSELAEGYDQIDIRLERDVDESLLSALGEFLRQMHDAGVAHKDLSPRNILVKKNTEEGGFLFLLLDCEDTRIGPSVDQELRREELHHFYERVYRLVPANHRRYLVEAYAAGENAEEWLRVMEEMVEKRPSKYTR